MFAPDFLRVFQPEYRMNYLHSESPILRKCCGCIHLRAGAMISCLIWMGLSLYFAAISFQHKSPFFSFMSDAAMLVFGTANLFFACIVAYGVFTVFQNNWYYVSHMVLWISLGVFVILVDGLVNVIIFIVIRNDYEAWCIGSASDALENKVESALNNNATRINFLADFYNCRRTWEDELKFSILALIMMIIFYTYWAVCFYSYSIKRSQNAFQTGTMRHAMVNSGQMMDPMMMNTMGGFGPYDGAPDPRMQMDHPNVIVLNNAKPSSKAVQKEKTRSKSSITTPPPPYPLDNTSDLAEKGRSSVVILE